MYIVFKSSWQVLKFDLAAYFCHWPRNRGDDTVPSCKRGLPCPGGRSCSSSVRSWHYICSWNELSFLPVSALGQLSPTVLDFFFFVFSAFLLLVSFQKHIAVIEIWIETCPCNILWTSFIGTQKVEEFPTVNSPQPNCVFISSKVMNIYKT